MGDLLQGVPAKALAHSSGASVRVQTPTPLGKHNRTIAASSNGGTQHGWTACAVNLSVSDSAQAVSVVGLLLAQLAPGGPAQPAREGHVRTGSSRPDGE